MTRTLRIAMPTDAPAMAAIKNNWIDATDWMPRVHPADDLERHYREGVIPNREVWVAGSPVTGFIALDDEGWVTSLFCNPTNAGTGKQLLDYAKTHRHSLKLWTFVANEGARRFYTREGFKEVERSEGDNEEGLPDVMLEWRAA